MREVTDAYPDRAMVGEVQGSPEEIAAYLGNGSDGLHMTFLLAEAALYWLSASTENAASLASTMDELARAVPNGGTFATLLGNHDIPRSSEAVDGDPAGMRVMAAAQLTMPGVPFVYYGEELGMRAGSGVIVDSRDSARTPMQWDASATAGFTTGTPFLAIAPEHETRNVESERADPSSMLAFYRRLIALRTATPALRTGTFQLIPGVHRSVLAHWRRHPDGDRIVLVNFSSDPIDVRVPLPPELATGSTLTDTLSEANVGAIADGAWTGAVPGLTAYVLAP
jgi:alpha-glucosidase